MTEVLDRLASIAVDAEPPLWGHIWTPEDRRSGWWEAPSVPGVSRDDRRDWYLSMGLARERGPDTRRVEAAAVAAPLAVMWADVDVACDWHTGADLAIDRDAALGLLHSIAEPSIVTATPGGVQGLWLAETVEPWDAAALAAHLRDVAATWAEHGRIHGARPDPVWNPDRLMRHPQSWHARSGTRVEVLRADGPWWTAETIGDRLMDSSEQRAPMSRAAERRWMETDVGAWHRPPVAPLIAAVEMLAGSPWRPTWEGRRADLGGDPSRHDLAVASWAAQVPDVTDEEIAQLVAERRRAAGAPPKSRPADYLRRTVARARVDRHRADSVTAAEHAAAAAHEDVAIAATTGEPMDDPLAAVSTILGVPVDGVICRQVPTSPESATWHLRSGGAVTAGLTARDLVTPHWLRAAVMAQFRRAVAPMSAAAWTALLQVILDAAVVEDMPDEADPTAMATLLLETLAEDMAAALAAGRSPRHNGVQSAVWTRERRLALHRGMVRHHARQSGVRDEHLGRALARLTWTETRPSLPDGRRISAWMTGVIGDDAAGCASVG